MRKCLFVFVLFFSFQQNHSQSYNTVTFTGNVNAFNNDERKWAGDDTRYYITYDENFIYALANRNINFGEYDHFTIYFDTDPQSDVTLVVMVQQVELTGMVIHLLYQ